MSFLKSQFGHRFKRCTTQTLVSGVTVCICSLEFLLLILCFWFPMHKIFTAFMWNDATVFLKIKHLWASKFLPKNFQDGQKQKKGFVIVCHCLYRRELLKRIKTAKIQTQTSKVAVMHTLSTRCLFEKNSMHEWTWWEKSTDVWPPLPFPFFSVALSVLCFKASSNGVFFIYLTMNRV